MLCGAITAGFAHALQPEFALPLIDGVAATRPDAVLTSGRPQPRPRAAFQASYSGRAASESG